VKALAAGAVFVVLLATGCATQREFTTTRHDRAKEIALEKGRAETACPGATARVLSTTTEKEGGVDRIVFLIQVHGCGERALYTVECPRDSDTCGAARPSALK
jgi:hypothetical protein